MARHVFSFNGGELLTSMGASWFVSYCYYEYIDKTHQNWNIVKTAANRKSVYLRTRNFHKGWLNEILKIISSSINSIIWLFGKNTTSQFNGLAR